MLSLYDELAKGMAAAGSAWAAAGGAGAGWREAVEATECEAAAPAPPTPANGSGKKGGEAAEATPADREAGTEGAGGIEAGPPGHAALRSSKGGLLTLSSSLLELEAELRRLQAVPDLIETSEGLVLDQGQAEEAAAAASEEEPPKKKAKSHKKKKEPEVVIGDARLFPTGGAREAWQAFVAGAGTHGQLGLAAASLRDHAVVFGLLGRKGSAEEKASSGLRCEVLWDAI